MKKLVALIAALVLALSCTAALAEGIVYVATNPEYPPFESVADDGVTIIGYEADLIDAIAKKAGFEYKYDSMQFASVVSAVQANPDTIGLSGISIIPSRLLEVNFSTPYINAGVAVIVKADSAIATVEDLQGKLIGAQLGTTSDFQAEEIVGAENVARYNTFLEAVLDLQGNKIDAVFVDRPVGIEILANLNDPSLVMLDIEIVADWYGIAVNKENTELLEKINAAIDELVKEGFFDELDMKYFGATGISISAEDLAAEEAPAEEAATEEAPAAETPAE